MWAMKHPSVIKQPNADAGTFRFGYFRAKRLEESFDVCPTNAAADRALENQLQRFLVLGFHKNMILFFDIMSR
jgi:hypothetical protein